MEEKFMRLVEKYKGFEMVLGYPDDEDRYIGGKKDKCWYYVDCGSKSHWYVGTLTKSGWTDRHYMGKGKKMTYEDVEPGTTIKLVEALAYNGQEEIEEKNKKGSEVEKHGIPVVHYFFGFGERGYDVSVEYGVTVDYSNINDLKESYHLRDLETGKKVKAPKEV